MSSAAMQSCTKIHSRGQISFAVFLSHVVLLLVSKKAGAREGADNIFGLPSIQRPTLFSSRNLTFISCRNMSHSGPIAGGMAMGAPPLPSVMDTRNNGSSRQYAEKEIYQYDAPWPVYALDWSKAPGDRHGFRLAVGSLIEEQTNKVRHLLYTLVS